MIPTNRNHVLDELETSSMLCLLLVTYEGRYGVLNPFGRETDLLAAPAVREEALAIAAHAAVALSAAEEIEE